MDLNLNQDTHVSVNRHVMWTAHFPLDDPRKFDLSTPNQATRAYMRIFNPITGVSPRGKQIVQDCNKVYTSMEIVCQAGGIRVDGVGERRGGGREHRQQAPRRIGGYLPWKSDPFVYGTILEIHQDAMEARLGSMRLSAAKLVDVEEEEDDGKEDQNSEEE